MIASYPDPVFVPAASLSPYPLSLKIYGDSEDIADLVDSIDKYGILRPLIVTQDNLVISGKRRLAAVRSLGLAEVPVTITSLIDPLEIELFLLEDNRTREQKAREFTERLRIESGLAKKRQLATLKQNAAQSEPSPVMEKLPQRDEDEEARTPPARELAATPLGWSGRTAEKAAAVIEYADQTGDRALVDVLNKKSPHTAYAELKKIQEGVKAPPFTPQYTNVWNFPGPTEGLGTDYPGRIPGDILRNLFWFYTQPDDLVVDVFAGGGVTLDAVAWWNEQADLWKLRCLAYDLVPSRPEITQRDVTQLPHLPDECQGAGLIFLDPPYWKQKRGDYSDDETNLANMGLKQFHENLRDILTASWRSLRSGGCLALLIGATQDAGQFIDHTLTLVTMLHNQLPLAQRVIVPYTTQQFSGADVAQARKSHMLLKAYRDLVVWYREQ